MELEIYFAGIGGQGIQLMAKVFALAALAEHRHVLLAAEYGFTMRGGSSLATVVVGSQTLHALPVVASAGAAIILHHQYLETPLSRLRPGALVVTDRLVADKLPPMPLQDIVTVDAARIANDIGNPMMTGLALMSAFNSITGLLRTESLVEAMKELVPSYRRQHVEVNERAIRLGAACVSIAKPIDLDAAYRAHPVAA